MDTNVLGQRVALCSNGVLSNVFRWILGIRQDFQCFNS